MQNFKVSHCLGGFPFWLISNIRYRKRPFYLFAGSHVVLALLTLTCGSEQSWYNGFGWCQTLSQVPQKRIFKDLCHQTKRRVGGPSPSFGMTLTVPYNLQRVQVINLLSVSYQRLSFGRMMMNILKGASKNAARGSHIHYICKTLRSFIMVSVQFNCYANPCWE